LTLWPWVQAARAAAVGVAPATTAVGESVAVSVAVADSLGVADSPAVGEAEATESPGLPGAEGDAAVLPQAATSMRVKASAPKARPSKCVVMHYIMDGPRRT